MGKISLSSGAVGAKGQAASRMDRHPQAVSMRGQHVPSLQPPLLPSLEDCCSSKEREAKCGGQASFQPQQVAAGPAVQGRLPLYNEFEASPGS